MSTNERLNKILNEDYEEHADYSIRSMVSEFYNKKMISMIIITWTYGITMMGLAIFCAVMFFQDNTVKEQVMYACGFSTSLGFLGLIKIFAWQVIHRNSLLREMKRLELAVAKLAERSNKEEQ